MHDSDALHSAPEPGWSPIVELRQYTLQLGQRDVLVNLFDSQLVEPQEQAGMKVIGQFRDLDDPDRFVWLRGFHDMSQRAQSLVEFYGGLVWQAHRDVANETMVNSDDVLLLRPARPGSAFTLERDRLPRSFGASRARGLVAATIMHLEAAARETEALSFFEQAIAPTVEKSGGSILAYFVTEVAENTFPSLPVREGEQVFVWFAGFADGEVLAGACDADGDVARTTAQAPGLERAPQVLCLAPTLRSLLHGRSPAPKCGRTGYRENP